MRELKKYVELLYYEYFQSMPLDLARIGVSVVYKDRLQITLPQVSPRLNNSFKHMLVLYVEKQLVPMWAVHSYNPSVVMIQPRD